MSELASLPPTAAEVNDPKFPVRLVYTDTLFVPRAFKDPTTGVADETKKFYGVNLVFTPDHPMLAAFKNAAVLAAKAVWPTADLKELFPADPITKGRKGWPFKDGNTMNADRERQDKKPHAWAKDLVIVQTKSKNQPLLQVVDGGKLVSLNESEILAAKFKGRFYSGVNALVVVNFQAWDKGQRSVTPYINQVFSMNTGDRISVGLQASRFEGVVGKISQVNPTAGSLDDGVPF